MKLIKKWLSILLMLVLLAPTQFTEAADVKISQLSTVTSPNTSDEVPVNNAGVTRKMTWGQLDTLFGITTHKNDTTIHRSINDSTTSSTGLWSSSKINTELGLKANTSHAHSAADVTSGTLAFSRGGLGFNTISSNRLIYASGANVLDALQLNSTLGITTGVMGVVDDSGIQKVTVQSGGSAVGSRRNINLTNGGGITWTVTDNSGSNRVDVSATVTNSAFPTLYSASASPVYSTASQITVARIRERNSDDDGDISKSTSTTVDISTTGLNGVAQSANLAGTISVTSGAATVTGSSTTFTTDYIVGDVIRTNGGQARRIITITNNTSMTVESNWSTTESAVAYRRGGEAPNTFYNMYATTNGTTPGLMLTTRNVANADTLVDFPSGYTKSRQIKFALRNDGSNNIIPFSTINWGSSQPTILYKVAMTFYNGTSLVAGTTNVLNAGTAGSFTSVSGTSFIPPISRLATYICSLSTGAFVRLRTPTDNLPAIGWGSGAAAVHVGWTYPIQTNSSQAIEYIRDSGTGTVFLDVYSFTVTEVP